MAYTTLLFCMRLVLQCLSFALASISLHCPVLHCMSMCSVSTVLHCPALYFMCTVPHFYALYCTILRGLCFALSALSCVYSLQHCSALSCTVFHVLWLALVCIVLHCPVWALFSIHSYILTRTSRQIGGIGVPTVERPEVGRLAVDKR
jgi:hypothetical protein